MYGIRVGRVLGWIKSGELRAIDVSAKPGVSRARYLIDRADLAAFDDRRTVRRPEPRKRRRTEPPSVIQFV